jgi:glycerol-3-phosphate acyltransferase PlsY
MNYEYFACGLTAYFLGTLSWAYILMKLFARSDIRNEGSGNVGAMNSYEVTGKKYIGIVVTLLDAGKGFAAVWIASLFSIDDTMFVFIGTIMVVLGHNYNVFLKFRGGRGLASAAGAFVFLNPLPIFLWLIMWGISMKIPRLDIVKSSVAATVISPIIIYLLPDSALNFSRLYEALSVDELRILLAIVFFVLLLGHIGPIWEMMRKERVIR